MAAPRFPLSDLLLAAILAAALAACGRPMSSTFPTESQQKLQAARHWEILASGVADKVKRAVDANPELAFTPIDVQPLCAGPFCEVYAELLRSQLVARAMQVASRDEGIMALQFGVQVLGEAAKSPSRLPGPGESGVAMSGGERRTYSGPTEVVVTSELLYQNRYLVHSSDIYYIDAADADQFGRPLPGAKPGRAGGRELGARDMRLKTE
jgi:hypothetical protein